MRILKTIALTLIIIGALNWGLIAFFQFDLVAAIFGGQDAFLSRLVYGLVGLSGLYYLVSLFNPTEAALDPETDKDKRRPGKLNYGTEFGEDTEITNRTAGIKEDSEVTIDPSKDRE
ncbi:DUF378 domain-containing protein [Oceanobacillus rekensis]|uniref:DUF378 domain-containing protein n=1 Tax=Oceanobacillus rekensis TaxID=937927 RepID=UPI000B44AC4F|nr:DUF378 domain-containing protein [Oceanobacillus rekensis]